MKARQTTLFLHPFFLISLFLLLLNDLYLKYEFHNIITGKLSDFTGLFIFAVFLVVLFPLYKKPVIIFCALFFCCWKTPLSSPFIDFFNYRLSLPLHRVVDYTDLFALLVLPLAYKIKRPGYSSSFERSAAIYTVGIISFFSFCATSMPRRMMYYSYRENEVTFYESFSSEMTEAEILKRLDPENIGYRKDSARFYRIAEHDNFYYRVKNEKDSADTWTPLKNSTDSALFIKKESPSFFIIPRYVLEKDTLYNLELRIYQNMRKKKHSTVQIESFQTNNPSAYRDFYYGKTRKRYKKHFKELFRH